MSVAKQPENLLRELRDMQRRLYDLERAITPTPAAHLWTGDGPPSPHLGGSGDYYFRADGSSGSYLYFNSGGTWGAIL